MDKPNSQTKRRATLEAKRAVIEALHQMDISANDLAQAGHSLAIVEVEKRLSEILADAYVCNHNQ